MPTFAMVNPVSQGTTKTVVKAKNSIEAANKLYSKLAEHFASNVEHLAFSVQEFEKKNTLGKGSLNKYTHFIATELRGTKNTNAIKVHIDQVDLPKKQAREIQKNFANVLSQIKSTNKLKGGSLDDIYAIDDDDDLFGDEDSDEEWIYNIHRHAKFKKRYPISEMWYYPWAYWNILPSSYINIPTFRLNMSPYLRMMAPLSTITIKKETKVVPPGWDD
jgi:hypothetical protein